MNKVYSPLSENQRAIIENKMTLRFFSKFLCLHKWKDNGVKCISENFRFHGFISSLLICRYELIL